MVNFERKETYSLQDLIEILRILRAPGGCPWDRAQTHLSDRRNFLEEAYEAAEAFDRDDPALMCEELGDMLMQVLFNIHIEEDAGRFTTDDVTDHICKKLIFRHPHVFGTAAADTSEEVLVNWEALKRQEKGQQTTADAMDAVARSLPALWRADKLQSKAAKAGFEFAGVSGALDKLDEETRELREAVERGTNFSEELGDVLFAAVKAGRFLNVDPEDALNATKAAVEEGIVAGGGTIFVNIIPAVTALLADVEGDEKTGVQIVAKALEEPIRQIAANAGLDGSVILEKVRTSGKNGYGFDAYKEEYCDMISSGIVDPAKVTRSALENAASVSGMVLTTESLVADKPQPAAPAAPAPDMGGMGGMY